ncbi:MAG: penicillin acylase family protein [Candidatus Abyssobacteria bacterium SURF_17]|uniref:Penicillin acylase family protein n=1 Tax=Candidatus Abyssobacteria bacterium SURF_17 TaxID=2093361 RepID=A0A419EQS3_9BACT|nr:MAG: penicillin acylase family protein [Candidatus Abyssubacteria bacterium SURF_17]
MRKTFWSLCFALAVVCFPSFCSHAEESQPLETVVGGIKDEVEILVDKNGFPHIYAQNETDAMFALGYVHARDRLWQMDFNRRAAMGRLSEILGREALDHDTFVRTIGLNRLAAASAERVKSHPRVYQNLVAYSWGVNTYLAWKLPEEISFEFRRMDYQPEPWSIVDSLAIGKAMAWELSGSLDDLYMSVLVERLGWKTVEELFPVDRHNEVPIIPQEPTEASPGDTQDEQPTPPAGSADAFLQILNVASHQFRIMGEHGRIGSNNWVIDGTKSATGRPLLASDPHLTFHLPCVWYVVHITGGNLDVTGVSLPGIPLVMIGHNRHVAWGVTNTQADVTDFFVETLSEEQSHYLRMGEWKPLEILTETIYVRGEKPFELEIATTAHGPLLATATGNMALRWAGAEPDDDALAFYLLNHAIDYDDFALAMQTLNSPAQNFCYADTNGMIALWVAGLFPIRKSGFGRIPVDGSSGEFDWSGFVPKIETPHSVNPSQHYLASANQRPAPKSYPYYLGYEWDPGYRARRINRLLASNDAITTEMMQSYQADTYDTAAESMLPKLIAVCRYEFQDLKPYAQVLDMLSDWDFRTTVDNPAPTIWWKWLDKLRDATWRDEWQAAGIYQLEESWGHTDLNKWQPPLEVLEQMIAENPTSPWFDDVSTEEKETLADIACKSLRDAVRELTARFGGDISEWRWGRTNRLRIDHLSGDPLLVRGGHPLSGSDLTLTARGTGGEVTGGPTWRMIVDFNDLQNSIGVFPGGQSGDPENPHYADLLDEWVEDLYMPLLFVPSPAQFPPEQIETRLKLVPPPDPLELITPEEAE